MDENVFSECLSNDIEQGSNVASYNKLLDSYINDYIKSCDTSLIDLNQIDFIIDKKELLLQSIFIYQEKNPHNKDVFILNGFINKNLNYNRNLRSIMSEYTDKLVLKNSKVVEDSFNDLESNLRLYRIVTVILILICGASIISLFYDVKKKNRMEARYKFLIGILVGHKSNKFK